MSNRIFLLLALLVLIDLYVFAGAKFLCRNLHPSTAKLIYILFWSISTICFSIILAANFFDWQSWSKVVKYLTAF